MPRSTKIVATLGPACSETDVLKRMLHDYVSFALFSAGAALGASAEAALLKSVREMLAVIKP
jgi:pyruvate kinase